MKYCSYCWRPVSGGPLPPSVSINVIGDFKWGLVIFGKLPQIPNEKLKILREKWVFSFRTTFWYFDTFSYCPISSIISTFEQTLISIGEGVKILFTESVCNGINFSTKKVYGLGAVAPVGNVFAPQRILKFSCFWILSIFGDPPWHIQGHSVPPVGNVFAPQKILLLSCF